MYFNQRERVKCGSVKISSPWSMWSLQNGRFDRSYEPIDRPTAHLGGVLADTPSNLEGR